MPPTNDFVPFCNENTGTNLPTQSAYLANPNLPLGNQPGIASSSFNNKALRQATTIAAILAQYTSNQLGVDMLDAQNTADHAVPTALLAALTGALKYHSPVMTRYASGSGNHNLTYKFQIASGSATAGATYTNNAVTYTVVTTVASGTQINMTGNGDPLVNGTLTKASGTGDATLTFYAVRKPIYLKVTVVGGGGGGGGTTSVGGDGGTSTFGTSLLTCTGGIGGAQNNGGSGLGGVGGTATSNSPAVTLWAIAGGAGGGSPGNNNGYGGSGGVSAFGGNGPENIALNGSTGVAGATNSGSGGAGVSGGAAAQPGRGGGAGAALQSFISSPSATYAYAVGAAGTNGSGNGAAGGSGLIFVEEFYQ